MIKISQNSSQLVGFLSKKLDTFAFQQCLLDGKRLFSQGAQTSKLVVTSSDIPDDEVSAMFDNIFGSPMKLYERTGRPSLAKPLQGPAISSYYFFPRVTPGFHNEEAEYHKVRKMSVRPKVKAQEEEKPTTKKRK